MSSEEVPNPKAQGDLTTTPFAHLLLYMLRGNLTGTLALWPPAAGSGDRRSGTDRILFDRGRPVAARLLEPASALDRGLLRLFGRPSGPYAFYEANLVGEGAGVLSGDVEPHALITASLRGIARDDAVSTVLDRFGDGRVRLVRGVDLSRYRFDRKESAFIEVLQAEPATVEELVATGGDPRAARRLLYLLAITKAIEPFTGSLPQKGPAQSDAHPDRVSSAGFTITGQFSTIGGGQPPAATERKGPSSVPPKRPSGGAKSVPPPPADLSRALVARWEEVRRFAAVIEDKNCYEMLGVKRDAPSASIRDAYFELAKIWHPDRLPPELVPLRPWADRIFHHLTQAKDTLMDPASRAEYLRSVQEGGGTPRADHQVNSIVTAALTFQKVEVLIRRREWAEAQRLLGEAFELNPEDADYFAARAWIQFHQLDGSDTDLEAIHKDLARALKLRENCERAHFYKGMILKRQNKLHDSLTHLRRAADINPKNIEAVREVRLAAMRDKGTSGGDGLLSKLFKKR